MNSRVVTSLFVFALMSVAIVGCATDESRNAPPPPDAASAAWGREVLTVSAKGDQLYRIDRSADGKLVPTFVGPRAELFDRDGRKIGTHFMGDAGPVWEIDGMRVTGRKLRERPSANSKSIPELQLAATVSGVGGPFAGVTFIERLDTVGGTAPTINASMHEGDVVESMYEAHYVFYAATR